MKIGNVTIQGKAALAPMASVADRAYRLVCKQMGAAFLVSEMISAKGLCYNDRKTEELCTVDDRERPYALQIFGEDEVYMGRAAGLLMKYKPDILDINMGCPVPKIAGNGAGSALMKDIDRAYRIVREAVKNSDVPVTVKIRAGWDGEHINAPEFAAAMESAGAAAVSVHGRTKVQMYRGKADRGVIKA
ncbi:MAG: tRNA-dihydrouridine synthase, partial [Ruminococcus sp.]|nr:tRNA-dihydrouridine synthase [Ruminococcus sp.]